MIVVKILRTLWFKHQREEKARIQKAERERARRREQGLPSPVETGEDSGDETDDGPKVTFVTKIMLVLITLPLVLQRAIFLSID